MREGILAVPVAPTTYKTYLTPRLIVIVGRMVGQAGALVNVRIGVISDTHGLLRPEVEQRLTGVEHIVHAGDIGRPDVVTGLRMRLWSRSKGMSISATGRKAIPTPRW